MQKCLSCGGIYNGKQKGGYYHVCPSATMQLRDERVEKHGKIYAEGKGVIEVSG